MIPLPQSANKTYLVLGFGKSGAASADALRASGARVLVWDDKEAGRAKAKEQGFFLSDPIRTDFKELSGLVVAPGVPLTKPAPHGAVLKARAADVPILSDMDFLFAACPKARYVGITGTNGKSTTTALIAHILHSAGRNVQMGGNIGTPVLRLEPLGAEGFYVIELSSYQLDLMRSNPLEVAVLLNVTPDHYERHGGIEGYIEAKMKIARAKGAQTFILGTDEPETKHIFGELRERKNLDLFEISSRRKPERGATIKDMKLDVINEPEPLDLKGFKTLPGLHNAQNAAAAFLACRALGLKREEILRGLESFPGLAHRQQLVARIDDIRFINDSKATNADAASKALACYDNIYWIIGGQPKPGGLSGLEELMGRVVHAFLIGQAAPAFALWCEAKNVPFSLCETLEAATQQAAAMALKQKRKDAVVLLSPACASWDQFASFEERGERFTATAKEMV